MQIGFTDAEFLQIAAKLERCDELQHNFNYLKADYDRYVARFREVESAKNTLQRNYDLQFKRINVFEKELSEQAEIRGKYRKKFDQLCSVIEAKNEELTKLETSINTKDEVNEKLRSEVKDIAREKDLIAKRNNELERVYEANGALLSTNKHLMNEVTGLSAKIANLEKLRDALASGKAILMNDPNPPAVDPAGPKGDVEVRYTSTGGGELTANPFDFGIARSPTSLGDGER